MPINTLPNNYIVTTSYNHAQGAIQTRVFVDKLVLVEDHYLYLAFNDMTTEILYASHNRVVAYIEQLPYAKE